MKENLLRKVPLWQKDHIVSKEEKFLPAFRDITITGTRQGTAQIFTNCSKQVTVSPSLQDIKQKTTMPLTNNHGSNRTSNFRDYLVLAPEGQGDLSFSWTPEDDMEDDAGFSQGRRTTVQITVPTTEISEVDKDDESVLRNSYGQALAPTRSTTRRFYEGERSSHGLLHSILHLEPGSFFPSTTRMTCLDMITEALKIVEANDQLMTQD